MDGISLASSSLRPQNGGAPTPLERERNVKNPWPACLALLLAVAVVTHPVLSGPPAGGTAQDEQRGEITRQLIDLGRAPADADRAASLLTPEDLVVLGDNPNMMQPAGSGLFWGIVLITALVVGIVLLAMAGSGFIMINP